MDKYINYKSQGNTLRKKFKSYKPFCNSELTSLWKDMSYKSKGQLDVSPISMISQITQHGSHNSQYDRYHLSNDGY